MNTGVMESGTLTPALSQREREKIARATVAVAAMLLVAMLVGRVAVAAPRGADWPGVKAMLAEQAVQVEKEIAARLLKRSDVAADLAARLEMEIDFRIIARWFFMQAAAAQPGGDLQITCRLRGVLCMETATAVDEALARQGAKLTGPQTAAMTTLHQLSFALNDIKSVKDADEISRKVGGLALAIGAGSERSVVIPRPKPVKAAASSSTVPSSPLDRLTPAQMADEARRLNVSVALRQQLLSVAAAAQADSDDIPRLTQTLRDGLELARALGNNTAVSADSAGQMERQLGEALALYLDVRTRSAGGQRMASLQNYRQMVTRIAKMNLNSDQGALLAPVFAWVRDNGDDGMRAFAAIERFHQARGRINARARQPNAMPQLRRAVEDLEKQFSLAGTSFATAVGELPKVIDPLRQVSDLEAKSDEIKRMADAIERLDQVPAAIDALNAFKPKPSGMIERRVIAAAGALSTSTPTGRQDAVRVLDQIVQLAKTVNDLSTNIKIADVPPAFDKRWTGGRLAALEARWRETAGELAAALAAGESLDPKKLSRLTMALSLHQSLKDAVAMDMALATSATSLVRWVDWRLGIDDLKPFLRPYPQAMSEAYTAYTGNAMGWEDKWTTTEKRYRPIAAAILRAAPYRDQCALFPAGLSNSAASLLVPMDNAPFSTERCLGFAAVLWNWHTQQRQPTEAADVLTTLGRRLGE